MVEMQGKKGYCRDGEQNAVQTILVQTAVTFGGGEAITVMSDLVSGNSCNQNQHTKPSFTNTMLVELKRRALCLPTNQSEAEME